MVIFSGFFEFVDFIDLTGCFLYRLCLKQFRTTFCAKIEFFFEKIRAAAEVSIFKT